MRRGARTGPGRRRQVLHQQANSNEVCSQGKFFFSISHIFLVMQYHFIELTSCLDCDEENGGLFTLARESELLEHCSSAGYLRE